MNQLDGYEQETMRLFQQLVGCARTFMDIGANIGAFTAAAKCFHPAVAIWAFEPKPMVFSVLKETAQLNAWKNVCIELIALADFDGLSTLYISGGLESSMNPAFRKSAVGYECIARKLDVYCVEHKIGNIDLIKVDTESTEPQVLRGGVESLTKSRPDIICEILADRTERELEEFLRPLGYSFYHITEGGLVHKDKTVGGPGYTSLNYYFTTKLDIAVL